MAGAVQQQDQRRDPRRFVGLSNPGLRRLLDETIGDGWMVDLQKLRGLERLPTTRRSSSAGPPSSGENKARLSSLGPPGTGIELEPDWMFDVQVKRIHEYKRQHLNALHIITLYNRLKQDPSLDIARAHSFSAARPRPAISSPN